MRCFKGIVAAAFSIVIGSSFASPILTSEDEVLIQQGQRIVEKARQSKQPAWQQNRHIETAQQEAKHFFNALQTSSSTIQAMQQLSMNKENVTPYKILIFVSHSLGGRGLNDLLDAVSGNPDAVLVFRGFPKNMRLGEGIKAIQALAAQKNPVPNIIIDPTLFRKHRITAVPTIVMLAEPSSLGKAPQVLASVQGISNLTWLARRVAQGATGDQGIKGSIETISEPDLIEAMQERFAQINWEKKKQQIAGQFWQKQSFYALPTAKKTQTRYLDPHITATNNIQAADGTVLIKRGTMINPLTLRDFTQAVVVFDPLDNRQLEWLNKTIPILKKRQGVTRLTLIATQFDKEKGWEAYTKLADAVAAPVYLLTPDLVERFALTVTPSVITAQDKLFVVEEIAPSVCTSKKAPA